MVPWNEGIFITVKWTRDGWWWDYSHRKVWRYYNRHHYEESSHMWLSNLCLGWKNTRQPSWITQVGTLITCRNLYWLLTISGRISRSGYKSRKLSFLTSIPCGVLQWFLHSSIYEGRCNTPQSENLVQHRSKTVQQITWTKRMLASIHILKLIPVILQETGILLLQRVNKYTNIVSVQIAHTWRSVQEGSIHLWMKWIFIIWGRSQYIKTGESLLWSNTIQYAQWDNILQGIWGIFRVQNWIKNT